MMTRVYLVLVSMIAAAAVCPAPAAETPAGTNGWTTLFDGKTLGQWKASDFTGNGTIGVRDGVIAISTGAPMSGITWRGEPPARMDYEIELEAMRTQGDDFFCGLTFPVGTNPCSLIVGGWAGSVTGLSSVNGSDASENETTSTRKYENNRWYRIRLKVTKSKIEAWIDDDPVVDLETEGRRFSVRWEVEPSIPLGLATWHTGAAVRTIRIRRVGE